MRVTGYYLLHELRFTFNIRLTSHSVLPKLRVTLHIRVTNYFLLHELRDNFYIRVTSCYVLHKLQVSFYFRVTRYYLLRQLQVKFIMPVTGHYLLHELRLQYLLCEVSLLYELFISLAWSLQNLVYLVNYSWAAYFMNECSNVKSQSAILSCAKFLYISMTCSWLLLGNTFCVCAPTVN